MLIHLAFPSFIFEGEKNNNEGSYDKNKENKTSYF